jgi:indole-3-glycerol phosphate synthase
LKNILGILGEIVEKRLVRIEEAKKNRSFEEVRTSAEKARQPLSLQRAIGASSGVSLIAEMKRATPSAGSLDPDLDPASRATLYCDAGATAISVLTEQDYFSGSIDDLVAVSEVARRSRVPVLRKDFIVDPYQVYEARAAGADCILLIIAILEPENYADLFTISTSMGMDVLVEVFDKSELDAAMQTDPRIIGVNNRNLKTLKTSLAVFEGLATNIPPDRIRVAESGMKIAADVERMGHAGAHAVLVGESLMKAGGDLRELAAAMAAVEIG